MCVCGSCIASVACCYTVDCTVRVIICFSSPVAGGSYNSENVPLNIEEEGLVILIANCRVKHEVSDGGYELRRDRCYEAAKIMGKPSLREATEKDIEGYNESLKNVEEKYNTEMFYRSQGETVGYS